MAKLFCRYGHNILVVGRTKSGNCTSCYRQWSISNYKTYVEAYRLDRITQRQLYPWRRHFFSARARIEGKRGKTYIGLPFTLTMEQIHFLWIADNASSMTQPELDKIIDSIGYVFTNCQFIERTDHLKKSRGLL